MKKTAKIMASLLTGLVGVIGGMAIPSSSKIQANGQELQVVDRSAEPLIKYDFLPEEEMPVLGYVALPRANAGSAGFDGANNPSFFTMANIEAYKNAGFNILSGLYEKEPFHTSEIRKAMELCQQAGIAYFVCDNTYRCDSDRGAIAPRSTESIIQSMKDKWYLNEASFGGLAVKDEPHYKDLDLMVGVNEALKELTDGKILYTNLFPRYASEYQTGFSENAADRSHTSWENYEKYVRKYVEVVKPDIVAYDFYVFMQKDATIESALGTNNIKDIIKGEINVTDYIKSLSMYREVAKENNIPFWVTVASYNHRHVSQFTQKQTEWTVNTSLAYGAKGIQYYTYWDSNIGASCPDAWENQQERGLVTLNGSLHDTYYRVKKINDNIKTVDHVLMKADHKGVIQFGKQTLALVPEDTLYGYGLLNNIVGGDTFVGCFDLNGKDVYYIVNNSVNAGPQLFKADFINKVNVRTTNLDGVKEYNDTYSVGFTLSGGEAILLEVL